MLLSNILALAAAFPAAVTAYTWNDQTKLYHIGQVPFETKSHRASLWMGRCGGDDIPPGGYACGLYGEGGSKGTVIYKCVEWTDGTYWLRRAETCLWAGAGDGGQCSRNQRRKGKKFYPFVDGKKAVCITTEMLQS